MAIRRIAINRATDAWRAHQRGRRLEAAVEAEARVHGDAAEPADALEDEAEGVAEHILGQVSHRQAREDDLAEQGIAVPGVQRARGPTVAALERFDHDPFVRDGGELCFVVQAPSSRARPDNDRNPAILTRPTRARQLDLRERGPGWRVPLFTE